MRVLIKAWFPPIRLVELRYFRHVFTGNWLRCYCQGMADNRAAGGFTPDYGPFDFVKI